MEHVNLKLKQLLETQLTPEENKLIGLLQKNAKGHATVTLPDGIGLDTFLVNNGYRVIHPIGNEGTRKHLLDLTITPYDTTARRTVRVERVTDGVILTLHWSPSATGSFVYFVDLSNRTEALTEALPDRYVVYNRFIAGETVDAIAASYSVSPKFIQMLIDKAKNQTNRNSFIRGGNPTTTNQLEKELRALSYADLGNLSISLLRDEDFSAVTSKFNPMVVRHTQNIIAKTVDHSNKRKLARFIKAYLDKPYSLTLTYKERNTPSPQQIIRNFFSSILNIYPLEKPKLVFPEEPKKESLDEAISKEELLMRVQNGETLEEIAKKEGVHINFIKHVWEKINRSAYNRRGYETKAMLLNLKKDEGKLFNVVMDTLVGRPQTEIARHYDLDSKLVTYINNWIYKEIEPGDREAWIAAFTNKPNHKQVARLLTNIVSGETAKGAVLPPKHLRRPPDNNPPIK